MFDSHLSMPTTEEILRILKWLPVGFGLRPTDEELVDHYLKSKIMGMSFHEGVIPEVDVYRLDPWFIPDSCVLLSEIQTHGPDWFFFSPLYKKYQNGNQLQRTTTVGYWKPTGPKRDIKRGATEEVIGTKRTLVLHMDGGPPDHADINTGWVIYEYHAHMASLPADESYVLCRLKTEKGFCFPLQTNLNGMFPTLPSNQEPWPMNVEIDDSSTGAGIHLNGPPNIMILGADPSHYACDIVADPRNYQPDDVIPEELALPNRPLLYDLVTNSYVYPDKTSIPQRRSAVDSGNLSHYHIGMLLTSPATPLKGAYGKDGGSSSDTGTQAAQFEAEICNGKGSFNRPDTASAGHEPGSSLGYLVNLLVGILLLVILIAVMVQDIGVKFSKP